MTGEGEGTGSNINWHLDCGARDVDMLRAWDEALLPAVSRFQPDFIIVSAGFDSRRDDLLGCFDVTDDAFRRMTRIALDLAEDFTDGRLVSLLEGGYNVEGNALAAAAHLETLLDGSSLGRCNGVPRKKLVALEPDRDHDHTALRLLHLARARVPHVERHLPIAGTVFPPNVEVSVVVCGNASIWRGVGKVEHANCIAHAAIFRNRGGQVLELGGCVRIRQTRFEQGTHRSVIREHLGVWWIEERVICDP